MKKASYSAYPNVPRSLLVLDGGHLVQLKKEHENSSL
jgi:hypothetical protein